MNLAALLPPPAFMVFATAAALAAWGYAPASFESLDEPGTANLSVSVADSPSVLPSLYESDLVVPESVLARPLMFAGRHVPTPKPAEVVVTAPTTPVPAAPVEPLEAVPMRPDVTFKGYVYANGRPQSLLKWGAEGTEEWLAIGAIHEGWRVEAISSKEVILRNGSDEFAIRLYE